MYVHWADAFIDEAKRRRDAAEKDFALADLAYRAALSKSAWCYCLDHNIFPGTVVNVDFEEGMERVLFEAIDWHSETPVHLRRFTTRGKPAKTVERYEWDVVHDMTPVKE